MKRLTKTLIGACFIVLLIAAPASASFGLDEFDVTFTNKDGSTATQAGSHPYAASAALHINSHPTPEGGEELEEAAKDVIVSQNPGLVGSATAVPRCPTAEFLTVFKNAKGDSVPACPDSTAIGTSAVRIAGAGGKTTVYGAIYNLEPPPGKAVRIGFWTASVPLPIELSLSESPPFNIVGGSTGIPQEVEVVGAKLTLWGVPADPSHDALRGHCIDDFFGTSLGSCASGLSETPFLTLPRACQGPLTTTWAADSWLHPGARFSNGQPDLSDPNWLTGSVLTHDEGEPPHPQGMTGCGKLAFEPSITSEPTSQSAESGAGLDFSLDFHDEGLTNPTGIAQSDVKDAEVILPAGVTINPSVGEGLGVCTPAQLARESAFSAPGEGCPNASKIGTLHVLSPLVDEAIEGSIFLAQQDDPATTTPGAENPFDSLIALYFVLKDPELGISIKEPVKIEPDPRSGQLIATLEENAQIPFSHFEAHLRTGARAALITPGACGTYTTKALLTPWANPSSPTTTTASFEITSGIGGSSCPPGGIPPFNPKFEAGAINNNAGSFSPFNMRLIRSDGEQDMTKFSAVLPPGELGSLAGVAKCPDSAIAIATSKTGRQELASPSCPANSLIGHTLAGAGVGSALTYVKGQIYLGGPFHGDPLSVIAVTPAVAGPFDAGTVVVRLALTLNPRTAEVEVDGANSEPIPHILKGIVLKIRDLRVYVDRSNFTLNPTSCDESSARAVLFGSYLNVLDPSDDRPVDLSTRYQAANCLNLGFKPKLALNLKGGTKRGGHPGLRAIYTPRKGDANVKGLVVRLPRSAFLDQAHIKTICTRIQFAAGGGNGEQCPAASKYGYIKAYTPLLDEPLEGPVFLRSSSHKLPDLVFALRGLVDIEVDVRIDSQHGGIRATVEEAPDAPLTKVDLRMQGAKKGLIINSRNLCGAPSHADVTFTGHNGKEFRSKPLMQPECGGKRKRHHRRNRG